MEKVQCIIVDEDLQAINRLSKLLSAYKKIEVVATATDSDEAIRSIIALKPCIVFLDIEMPRKSGFDIMEEVRENQVFSNFILVTDFKQYAIKAIKKQVFDYLLKPINIDELKEAISRFDKGATPCFEDQQILQLLSEREKEVWMLIAAGNTSREVAEKLCLSKHTVNTHRRNINRKIKNNCSKA